MKRAVATRLAAADPTNLDTFNRYAYVLNNPTNLTSLTDPSELDNCQGCDLNCPCGPGAFSTNCCDPNDPACPVSSLLFGGIGLPSPPPPTRRAILEVRHPATVSWVLAAAT